MIPGLLIAGGVGAIVLAIRSALRTNDNTDPSSDEADMVNGDIPWSLTPEQFQACFPTLSAARAMQLYPFFLDALDEVPIGTQAQLAAFVAQLGHESLDLRVFTEYASGEAYEGRADLGNVQPGDGPRYKGRGAVMITGRFNYRLAGSALGVDLELDPALASTDVFALRVAAWFWQRHDLNRLADQRQFVGMTRVINGGTNGLADRQTRLARACRVLGIVTAWS